MSEIPVSSNRAEFLPQRPGENIAPYLEILSRPPEFELTPEQKRSVLDYEKNLTQGRNLTNEEDSEKQEDGIEHIWRKKVNTSSFFLEYFLTEQGRTELGERLGVRIDPEQIKTVEDVKRVLYSFDYTQADIEEVKKLSGSSQDYMEETIGHQFEQAGFEVTESVEDPHQILVVRNPGIVLEKMKGYRSLKEFYKEEINALESQLSYFEEAGDTTNFQITKAKLSVLRIHKRKINTLMADLYPTAFALYKQRLAQGIEENSDLEELFKGVKLANNPDNDMKMQLRLQQMLSLVDRFVHGSGGNSQPISKLAEQEADKVVSGNKTVSAEDNVKNVKVNAETWKQWVQIVLAEYGLLSDYKDYNPDRETPAEDGKWQVVIRPEAKSLSVNSRQRVVKVPSNFNRKIDSVNPTGAIPVLDHEVGGHLVQYENKRRIGLAIFEEVGGDRSSINAEAGAIALETQTQAEMFGQDRSTNPHYLRAIQAKL